MLNQRSFCAYCSLLHSAICALRWISFSLFTCLQWAQSIFYYFLFSVHFFKQCFQYISNECNFVVTYLHLGVDSILNHPFGTLEWRLGQMNVEIKIIYWCTTVLNVQRPLHKKETFESIVLFSTAYYYSSSMSIPN